MSYTIALAGNPNCGKTTLFNELTGSKQHVGNWPGVTVDKKEGTYKKNKEIIILDLPGTYSLSPYSAEEIVARNYIVEERPDAVINIVDATSIERNLYLTLQILETGIPMVVALNMMDEVERRGDQIDCKKLSKELGVPVIPITARNGAGIQELMKAASEVAKAGDVPAMPKVFDTVINDAVEQIADLINDTKQEHRIWTALKLVEGDEKVCEEFELHKNKEIKSIVEKTEELSDGDTEAKIADLRYQFIGKAVKHAVKKKQVGHVETKSDKIDKVLTNRILALPIFIGVMYLLFSITFSETLFGVIPGPGVWLQSVVCDFWDGPLTETILQGVEQLGASEWAISLIGEGILAGLGGIFSFLPQILILFLLMSVLEDSGYMARVAFVMDKLFRKFGLSGKSFIPLLMGFGCGVPAIMATRTLESEKDRRLTIMITTFMSCGAKLPIWLMFAAAIFADSNQTLIVFSIYMLGLVVAVLSAIFLNKVVFKSGTSNFIMELPQYRIPTIKSVAIHGWQKVKGFVIKAGTIIFASTVLIWLLSRFSFTLQFLSEEEMDQSIIATIGNALRFLLIPLGFGNDWRPAVGTLTGFIAKENIVSTFGVLFGATEEVVEAAMEGAEALPGIADVFNKASAFSYMAFNLLCMPCFAAVGAIRREMGSWKWALKTVGFQMGVAWVVGCIIYQVGRFLI